MDEGKTGQTTPMSREELMSALFANMILQQTNLAMMFLGRVPHPETGEHVRDLEMAQMFIDQLEMLEAKTKNNLSKQEETLLRQSLTAVRMAYVEGMNQPEQKLAGKTEPRASAPAGSAAGEQPQAAEAAEPEDSRKKFTKKY
jgi:hypothetical protein